MDLNDYVIDLNRHEWAELLEPWKEMLPETFSLFLANRLGEHFIIAPDGAVLHLDVGAASIKKVADNRDVFADSMAEQANRWLLIPIVDAMVEAGHVLHDGQMYSWKVPPFLGGKYELENLHVADVATHFGLLGDIWRKVKDLPDGAEVSIKLNE